MAQFIHLFDARKEASLRRSGIRPPKGAEGVYCVPVTRDHTVTHQWMRELRRRNKVPFMAAQFRIPDAQAVSVGRFNDNHLDVSASEAVAIVAEHKAPFGLEVIIPRAVKKTEIMKFYTPPKIVGWRYWPEARGNKPCTCKFCQDGAPYSNRLKKKKV